MKHIYNNNQTASKIIFLTTNALMPAHLSGMQ